MSRSKVALYVSAAVFSIFLPFGAHAATLNNGDFDAGTTHTSNSIYNGNPVSNPNVPTGWTSDPAFDSQSAWNTLVIDTVVRPAQSGCCYLQLGGASDLAGPATLSQTFSDTIGQLYTASFYFQVQNGQTGDFLDVKVGSLGLHLLWTGSSAGWVFESFSFFGTGSDTISISGINHPQFWWVDTVSVDAVSTSATPLPGALPLLASGLGAMGLLRWRRKKKAAALAA